MPGLRRWSALSLVLGLNVLPADSDLIRMEAGQGIELS
jgi:hypothetical protein